MPHLMFFDSESEDQFRQFVSQDVEVGGYLVVSPFTPKGLDLRQLKRNLQLPDVPTVSFIKSWVVIPNDHPEPRAHHQSFVEPERLLRLAKETAVSMLAAWIVHFHTHPSGNTGYAQAEIDFWKQYSQFARSAETFSSIGVIVTPRFDWGVYYNTYSLSGGVHLETEREQFISWQDVRVKNARRAPQMPLKEEGAW